MAIKSVKLMLLMQACLLSNAWENSYDGPVQFKCDPNQYLSDVESQHDNAHEDRQWQYTCRALPNGSKFEDKCTWFNDVNEMDELLAFRCRGNGVIAGVNSHHDNHYEDRVFGFQCCNLVETKLESCTITTFLNHYDGLMNYSVPIDYAIIGFISENNNSYEDRRWKAEVCQIQR